MIEGIVKRALVETVTDIGQLTDAERRQLNAAVRKGWLSKGKGGPYPIPKTVYAFLGFDFHASRKAAINLMLALAELDRVAKEHRVFHSHRIISMLNQQEAK